MKRLILLIVALSALLSVAPRWAQAQLPLIPPARTAILLPVDTVDLPSGALLWLAQSYCDGNDCDDAGTKSGSGSGGALNKGTTRAIVRLLKEARETCDKRMDRRYRIDCLRIYYGWIADELPDRGDYAPIKKAMRAAEKKLDAIVRANRDTSIPKIEPGKGHKPNAPKMPPIRPVKKAAAKKAVAQAAAVIKETEIVILRAGEDPTRRTAHYTEVATALESNLVVLRSA